MGLNDVKADISLLRNRYTEQVISYSQKYFWFNGASPYFCTPKTEKARWSIG